MRVTHYTKSLQSKLTRDHRSKRTVRGSKRSYMKRLSLEALEDRQMLTTTFVDWGVYAEINPGGVISDGDGTQVAHVVTPDGHALASVDEGFVLSDVLIGEGGADNADGESIAFGDESVGGITPQDLILRLKITGGPLSHLPITYGAAFLNFDHTSIGSSDNFIYVDVGYHTQHPTPPQYHVAENINGTISTYDVGGGTIYQKGFKIPVEAGDRLLYQSFESVFGQGSRTAKMSGVFQNIAAPAPGVDQTAPQVLDVSISGSSSPDPAYSYAGHVGSGEQLLPAPVRNADTITISFSEDVYISEHDLTLVGTSSESLPDVVDFIYNGDSASWVFDQPFEPGQYRIVLDDLISDGSFNWLDGEWDNPTTINDVSSDSLPSGSGTAGGNFLFDFTTAYVVSTEVDESDGDYSNGDLSLREALALAETAAGHETIVFDSSVEEILLTGTELAIDSDVDILGPDANVLTIDAQESSRVFNVSSGTDAIIQGLTITGGGDESFGGGIYNAGSLEIIDSVVTHNEATINGGGIFSMTSSSLSVVNSTISNNLAQNGGGITAYEAMLTMANSSIVDNTAAVIGGNVYVYHAPSLDIDSSTISGGEASSAGGIGFDLYSSGSAVNATIRNSTIAFNAVAESGGAAYVTGNGNLNIQFLNTTISNNSAQWGAGLFVGHLSSSGNLWLVNSTIVENEATTLAGGIYIYGSLAGPRTRLHNTIVAENLDGGAANNIYGNVRSTSSRNLIGFEGTGGLNGTTNILLTSGQSAGLAPLNFYGGPTKTHALLDGSLAIDAGDNANAVAFSLLTDQRGESRIDDGDDDTYEFVDIGAFELGAAEYFGSI